MRAPLLCGGLLLALAGCGNEVRAVNEDRPASAINVTAAIIDDRLTVSPTQFGAGPVRLLVANRSGEEQELTFETAGREAGITASTAAIRPNGTATLSVEAAEGDYELRAADRKIDPVAITVGAPRESAQAELLQP